MNRLDDAMRYIEYGWNPIPLGEKSKRSVVDWKIYQEQRATKEDVKRWFKDTNNNVGIVTGKISNLVVIDCDNEDAVDWYYFNTNPSGRSVITPRGLHFYHSYAPSRNRQKNGLDVRSDGGYIVAPSSQHPDGGVYDWDTQGEMTAFDPNWFADTREQIKTIVNTGLNYDIAVVSCIKYIDKMEPAISGKGGHNQTFKVSCRIRDFVSSFMSPSQAMPIIRRYNERCDPPWTEKELLKKLEDAWKWTTRNHSQ